MNTFTDDSHKELQQDILESLRKLKMSEEKSLECLKTLETAADNIMKAKNMIVFTGAGMSEESGINTFKGTGSLWNGIFGKIVLGWFGTATGWYYTPQTAWSLYLSKFYKPIKESKPNPGHESIVELEQMFPEKNFAIITQNVDGLHQKAGNTPSKIHELHGSVHRYKCIDKNHPYHGFSEIATIPITSPKCMQPSCDSTLRPDCVLYQEQVPDTVLSAATMCIRKLEPNDVMLMIGTSASVYPAAHLPRKALTKGALIIDLNIQATRFQYYPNYLHVEGKAGEMLPLLLKIINTKFWGRDWKIDETDQDSEDKDTNINIDEK